MIVLYYQTISKLQKNKKNSKAKTCINYSFKEINYSCFLNVGTDPRLWQSLEASALSYSRQFYSKLNDPLCSLWNIKPFVFLLVLRVWCLDLGNQRNIPWPQSLEEEIMHQIVGTTIWCINNLVYYYDHLALMPNKVATYLEQPLGGAIPKMWVQVKVGVELSCAFLESLPPVGFMLYNTQL